MGKENEDGDEREFEIRREKETLKAVMWNRNWNRNRRNRDFLTSGTGTGTVIG
jgi:hypothetical protein